MTVLLTAKETIINAYLQLLREYPPEKLSVKKIADAANISRSTYYLHFPDKSALMNEVKEKLYRHFLSCYKKPNPIANAITTPLEICEHVFKYRAFYSTVFKNAQEIQQLSNLLKDLLTQTFNDPDYAIFASYGTIGYLSIWVQNDFQMGPKEAAEKLLKIGLTNWAGHVKNIFPKEVPSFR